MTDLYLCTADGRRPDRADRAALARLADEAARPRSKKMAAR